MDNAEKLATLGIQDTGQRLEKTKGAIKNGQSRDTGQTIQRHCQHWAHKTQEENKHNTNNLMYLCL